MKNVWTLKVLDWNPDNKKYEERWTSIHGGSLKARRAAVELITISQGEKELDTHEYSKSFYTLTSGSGNTHCIVSKIPVW